MRNWNKDNIIEITSAELSFESTYEELKHFYSDGVLGLNPRFESTYEELKPGIVTHQSENFLVLSLPMRNWNVSGKHSIRIPITSFESTYEELKLPAS